MKMPHRTVRGRIRYTSKKPELMDQERGREWFAFTHHGDGSVVLRAQCEIEEPDPTVLREVVLSLGPDGKARNLHVHLTVGDEFMGSGWFNFTHRADGDGGGGLIECESFGPSIGRLSQRIHFAGPIDGIGTHPIVGDGYLTKCMDVSKGPHRRTIRCSIHSRTRILRRVSLSPSSAFCTLTFLSMISLKSFASSLPSRCCPSVNRSHGSF